MAFEVIHRVHRDDRHHVPAAAAPDDCGLHIRTDDQMPIHEDADAPLCRADDSAGRARGLASTNGVTPVPTFPERPLTH
jgi:hypothetical protein